MQINRSMVARWIRHLLRLTTAQSLRLCTWWIHSAVPAGKSFFCLSPCDGCIPRAFCQKAAILFKAINRNKPFNGSAMNSPPTPPYCGSFAAALHLINSQIRCGSCREKVYFCLSPCDGCNPTGDDVAGWKSGACSGISSRHSIKGSSEPFASSASFFSGFCLSFIRSISEQFVFQKVFSINAH